MAGSASVSAAGPAPAPALAPGPGPEPGLPSQHIGLDAYITRPKRNGKARNRPDTPEEDKEASSVVCPVCEEFNGDEAAVAYHVAGHFECESPVLLYMSAC